MDDVTIGVAAVKAWLEPHINALPWWQQGAARSFLNDENLTEVVAAALDAINATKPQTITNAKENACATS